MSYQNVADLVNFRFIEGGRNLPKGGFVRNEWMDISQVGYYRMHHNNIGIYTTAYVYDQQNPNEANLYGNFYLDFDAEDDVGAAQMDAQVAIWHMRTKYSFNLPEEAFHIYFSGSKGFHIIIKAAYFGYAAQPNLNGVFKLIAKDLAEQCPNGTLDLKIYDKRRLMRMPNSIHPKTNLYKVPLTYAQLTTMTPDEIREAAKENYRIAYPPAVFNKTANAHFERYEKEFVTRFEKTFNNRDRYEKKALDFVPACIQNLLDQGPIKGQRNETACVLTSFFRNQGLTQDETWGKLVEWNNGSISENELQTSMTSIWNRGVSYGCSTLETISVCVEDQCPLFKPRIKS